MDNARSHLNRMIVLSALVVVLPLIAISERIHRGWGRAFAVRAIRRTGRLCGVTFDVRSTGSFEERGACVLVPNHTSPIDIAAVLVARPDVRFVAAAELFRIPLLRTAMRALGTVPIRRGDPASARTRIDELSRSDSDRELVMFPEGGIAPTAEVLPFKTGPFVVAIETRVPVVPVAISGAARTLPPGGRLRLRPGTVRIDILDPLTTVGFGLADRRQLADTARDRVRTALADEARLARRGS